MRLGEIEGVFTLPDPLPKKMLFISAGSGITPPIMSMLRDLDHRDRVDDVVAIHSAHSDDQVMFRADLESMDDRHDGFDLTLRITGRDGRIKAADLDELCPDWREREAMCSGPRELLDSLVEHFESEASGTESISNVSSRSSVGIPARARVAPSGSRAATPRSPASRARRSSSRGRRAGWI